MPHNMCTVIKHLISENDGHLLQKDIVTKGWKPALFTNGQNVRIQGKEFSNESEIILRVLGLIEISQVKAIILDNDLKEFILSSKIDVERFVLDNFIFNFLIFDEELNIAYLHDNYNDLFILYSRPWILESLFGIHPREILDNYLGYWTHPETAVDEIKTAKYFHTKYKGVLEDK